MRHIHTYGWMARIQMCISRLMCISKMSIVVGPKHIVFGMDDDNEMAKNREKEREISMCAEREIKRYCFREF